MNEQRTIESTALRAVLLCLYLGEDSFDKDEVNDAALWARFSPIAGRAIPPKDIVITTVGPSHGVATHHVIITMRCSDYEIGAYCLVEFNGRMVKLVHPDIYVNHLRLTPRKVSVTEHGLDPWGTPSGYNMGAVFEAVNNIPID